MKHQKIPRKPMPTSRSVHWLPVGDSRYVIASLRSGDGQPVFVTQNVLSRLNALAAASGGARALGLLLGSLYECPIARATYIVIDALGDRVHDVALSDRTTETLRDALQAARRARSRALGWYCIAQTTDRVDPEIQAAHAAVFGADQTSVVLALAADATGIAGIFLRRDPSGATDYRIPFHELVDAAVPRDRPGKPTCIGWPTYVTADVTFPIEHVRTPTLPARVGPSSIPAKSADNSTDSRPRLWRSLRTERARPQPRTNRGEATAYDPPTHASMPVSSGAGALHDERAEATLAATSARDDEDTSASDSPERYLRIAQQDGFFVAARFGGAEGGRSRAGLWVLHDPYCGLLLLVQVDNAGVLDATLHYNVRVPDAAMLATAYSEHVDRATMTVYKRETCADTFRAVCAQLRESGMLVAEWKVTPTITFITTSEWESLASDTGEGTRAIRALNRQRIAALPEPIVSRYGLHA